MESYLVVSPRKRVFFSPQEDQCLRLLFFLYGYEWKKISKELPGRTPRQCRDRYINYLDPKIIKSPWSKEDDLRLIDLKERIGQHWTKIAEYFPGRTDSNIKNRWYKHIKPRMRSNNQLFEEKNPQNNDELIHFDDENDFSY